MVNINKLKGKIVERGLTIEGLAGEISVNPSTLYRKMGSGGSNFSIREAELIAKTLELSPEEATAIFFDQNVAQYATR